MPKLMILLLRPVLVSPRPAEAQSAGQEPGMSITVAMFMGLRVFTLVSLASSLSYNCSEGTCSRLQDQ